MSQPIQEPTIGLGEDIEAFGYKQELRRGLQLHDVVLYGVLFMVLIAPQSIWGSLQVDSGGLTPLVYIIGFVAISFTALSYAAMSSKFPIAGSVYSYVQRAINPHVGFMSGWLILLDYILVPSLLLVMVANWGTTLVPGSPWWLWVVVFIAFNTFVNVRGITMSKGVDWIIFAVEILALIVFIAVGCMYVSGGGGYYVTGTISELERDKLELGSEVTISDWRNGTSCTGTVQSIGDFPSTSNYYSSNNNPNASFYPFTVLVDEDANLVPGDYVDMEYSLSDSTDGIYLSNPFVRTEQGASFVYVQGENGKLERRNVVTGKSVWGSYTQILSGITVDDLIAFPYGKNVKPGVPTEQGDYSTLYEEN